MSIRDLVKKDFVFFLWEVICASCFMEISKKRVNNVLKKSYIFILLTKFLFKEIIIKLPIMFQFVRYIRLLNDSIYNIFHQPNHFYLTTNFTQNYQIMMDPYKMSEKKKTTRIEVDRFVALAFFFDKTRSSFKKTSNF